MILEVSHVALQLCVFSFVFCFSRAEICATVFSPLKVGFFETHVCLLLVCLPVATFPVGPLCCPLVCVCFCLFLCKFVCSSVSSPFSVQLFLCLSLSPFHSHTPLQLPLTHALTFSLPPTHSLTHSPPPFSLNMRHA